MSDDERTQRLDPSVMDPWAEPTRRIARPEDAEPTQRLAGSRDEPSTVMLDRDPSRGLLPGAGQGDEERRPGWALPLVTAIIGAMAGLVLALLLGGGAQDVVPRQTLVEQQAAATAALQDAQAQISQGEQQIAALEQQLAELQEDREAANTAQQEALDARQAALDEREAALNAREQALNDRDQAQDGGVLPDVDLPGVDLPDVSLPDVDIPEEEARNLFQRFLDFLNG
jgi:hypothetical protein